MVKPVEVVIVYASDIITWYMKKSCYWVNWEMLAWRINALIEGTYDDCPQQL